MVALILQAVYHQGMTEVFRGHENEPSEGERYLDLLGLGHLSAQPIPGHPGLVGSDFLDICGEHARPLLIGLESLDQHDQRFEPTRAILASRVAEYMGIAPSEG